MILSLDDILNGIFDFVNGCLGPLGQGGLDSAAIYGYMRDLIIQLLATLIIFLMVRYKFWKPITNILESRRKAMDEAVEAAEASNKQAQEYEEELRLKLENAQLEIKSMIETAEKEALMRKEDIIQEAKAEAQRRLDNVRNEIELEIKNKNNEIKQTIVDVAFLAASKIVEQEVDKEKYLAVVNEIIEGAAQ